MSLLTLDISKCVCPVETIKIDEGVISFVPSECVGCGGCDAV